MEGVGAAHHRDLRKPIPGDPHPGGPNRLRVGPPARSWGPAGAESETAPTTESVFYTVQGGDSLSKIAKEHYGSANKYSVIFEANKPMLTDPDKIYPGQVLVIPAL